MEHNEDHGVYQNTFDSSIYHRYEGHHRTKLEKDLVKYYNCDKECVIFPSGMNAIYNTIELCLPTNGKLLVSKDIYSCTKDMCKYLTNKKNASHVTVNIHDNHKLMNAFKDNLDTSVFYFESASNPEGKIINHELLQVIKNKYGSSMIIIVDNTWLSGCSYNPFEYGADVVVESLTKYIGECRYISGAVLSNSKIINKLKKIVQVKGLYVNPVICNEFIKGLHTVENRIKQIGTITNNIALWLNNEPRVNSVLHISLPSHPSHEQLKYIKYYPGIVYFQVIINSYYKTSELVRIIRDSGIECGPSYGSIFAKINHLINCVPIEETSQFNVWLRLALGSQTNYNNLIICLDKLLKKLNNFVV